MNINFVALIVGIIPGLIAGPINLTKSKVKGLATFTMDSAGIGSKVGDILESAALNLPIGLPLQISGLVANISGLVTRLASNLFPDKIFEAEEPHKTSNGSKLKWLKWLKNLKPQASKPIKNQENKNSS